MGLLDLFSSGPSASQTTENQQVAVGAPGAVGQGGRVIKGGQGAQGGVGGTISGAHVAVKGAGSDKGNKTPLGGLGFPSTGTPDNTTGNVGAGVDASVTVTTNSPETALAALTANRDVNLSALASLHDVSLKVLESSQYSAQLANALAKSAVSQAGAAESRVIEIAGAAAPQSPAAAVATTETNYNKLIIATAVLGAIISVIALYVNSRS